jgi:Protein of unknown function (DUF1554)
MVVGGALLAAVVAACSAFGADTDGAASTTPPSEPADAAVADGALPPAPDGAAVDPDGGPVAPSGCNGNPVCRRVVFVTSTPHTGALGGLSGADKVCNQVALTSGHKRIMGRTYVAWLSAANTPVAGRIPHGSAPYVRADDVVIATDWDDLTTGGLSSAVALDENGSAVGAGVTVWTGTLSSGVQSPANCADWSSDKLSTQGLVGAADQVATWTNAGGAACSAPSRLYCVEY